MGFQQSAILTVSLAAFFFHQLGSQLQGGEDQGVNSKQNDVELWAACVEAQSELRGNQTHAAQSGANGSPTIYDAWDKVRGSVPLNVRSQPAPVNKEALQRFLGFVEGYLRVPIPSAWDRVVESACAFDRNQIIFRMNRAKRYEPKVLGFKCQNGLRIKYSGDALVFESDGLSIKLPKVVTSRLKENLKKGLLTHLSVSMTPTRCVIASHADMAIPFDVICVDRVAGKIIWQSKAQGSSIRVYMGPHRHSVYVTQSKDAVIVFGVEGYAIYIEGFEVKSGRRKFMFTSVVKQPKK